MTGSHGVLSDGVNHYSDINRFDFGIPFDIMVGLWDGLTTVYTSMGKFSHSYAGRVLIYWVKRGELLRYYQAEMNFDDLIRTKHVVPDDIRHADLVDPHKEDIARIVRHRFDLRVSGKFCESTLETSSEMQVVGTETQPGTYHFQLALPNSKGVYYNNQYFSGPNERHIIGPYVQPPIARPSLIVSQTFARLSYIVNDGMLKDFNVFPRSHD